MKAMILAAGLGTRLRPLTNDRPKALVEVGGRTMLEITLRQLAAFGIREVIINVHHFADMVVAYLKEKDNFGLRVEISREEVLLDTGGGLKNAAWFFLENSSDAEEPFLLHNVDVISTINLNQMMQFHRERNALATLAVQQRDTSRYLLFDSQYELCGRMVDKQTTELVRPTPEPRALAFCGIHLVSTRFLQMMSEDGVFSIITSYLRLAAQGEKIVAFRADDSYWRDLGKIEAVSQATHDLERGIVRF
jgi:NDP-sugar pyrophosphorylase family protein